MIHHASPDFWEAYDRLPEHIRSLADHNFSRLKENPAHPSLQFKPVGRFWSVRVGLHCRALAVRDRDDLIWFWIGSHVEYDQLIG